MALYAIGDLHLSLGADKPMDVFGPKWENYVERIRENFSRLREDDVTVLAGDTSWGISLEQALPDFRFIDALGIPADFALIDGNRDHGAHAAILTPHRTIVGGDGISLSIAAASVLAKVSRDRYVAEVLDPMYPEYQFARHKGYATKLHYEMLDRYGPSPVHRMTFLKKWEARR